MEKKKVYIAGPFCDLDEEMVEYRFAEAQKQLEAQDFEVFNHVQDSKKCRNENGINLQDCEDCFKKRMIGILRSECVYMLPNWQNCKEANRDRNVAMALEIPIIYL